MDSRKFTTKSLLPFLLVVILVCTSVTPAFAKEYDQQDSADISTILGSSQGLSSAEQPNDDETNEELLVSTFDELKDFAERVNSGDSMQNVSVKLTGNITIDGNWSPIGDTNDHVFSGVFDGQSHEISGINVAADLQGGLFGYLNYATVKNLTISNFLAPNSTSGMFFFAAHTTITDCNYLLGKGSMAFFSVPLTRSPYAAESVWSGNTAPAALSDGSTTIPANNIIIVNHADDLAWIGYKTTNLGNGGAPGSGLDFAGVQIILNIDINLNDDANWKPIGTNTAHGKNFKGNFDGAGHTIRNLKSTKSFGIFNEVIGGIHKNIVLENFNIDDSSAPYSDPMAALIVVGQGTNISDITLRNSKLIASGQAATIGGIIGTLSYSNSEDNATIQRCIVENTDFVGDSNTVYIGGIAAFLGNYAITESAVYGGSITGEGTIGGIVASTDGPNGTYSTVSQCVVMGTEFIDSGSGTPYISGVVGNLDGWNTASDNFVTNISTNASAFHIGFDYNFNSQGAQRFLTDSTLTSAFVPDDIMIINNYWDDIVPTRGGSPQIGTWSNYAYSTAFLTDGIWTPSNDFWTATEGYYPEVTNLKTSSSRLLKELSGLAAIALRPENELEKYTTAVKELRLMDTTTSGTAIDWSWTAPASAGLQTEPVSGKNYKMLYTHSNDPITPFDITASITVDGRTYKKTFEKVAIEDRLLNEDIPLRQPIIPVGSTDTIIPIDQTVSHTFIDPITINPNVVGMVRLYAYNEITDSWIVEPMSST